MTSLVGSTVGRRVQLTNGLDSLSSVNVAAFPPSPPPSVLAHFGVLFSGSASLVVWTCGLGT